MAVQDGEILLDDASTRCSRSTQNTPAVTVHGMTRDESRGGVDEPEALERFLDYLGDGVIVGHHIGHDIATLDAGYERHWGFTLANRSLDTMDLTLHLERDGAFAGRPPIRHFTLDALCEMFGVDSARPAHRRAATPSSPRRCSCGWSGWRRSTAATRSAGSASHSRLILRKRDYQQGKVIVQRTGFGRVFDRVVDPFCLGHPGRRRREEERQEIGPGPAPLISRHDLERTVAEKGTACSLEGWLTVERSS